VGLSGFCDMPRSWPILGLFKVEACGRFGVEKAPMGSHVELCQVIAADFA
jgi:hypothetical protein